MPEAQKQIAQGERTGRARNAFFLAAGAFALGYVFGCQAEDQESDWDRAIRLVDEKYTGDGGCLEGTAFDPDSDIPGVGSWLHLLDTPESDVLSIRTPAGAYARFEIGPDGTVDLHDEHTEEILARMGCVTETWNASE